jgi:hypothetical protein
MANFQPKVTALLARAALPLAVRKNPFAVASVGDFSYIEL